MTIPLSLSPSLWLDASALAAGSLALWSDKSGNGNDATQSNASYRPTVIAGGLNGLPVVQANPVGGMILASGSLAAQNTIFAVASPSSQNGYLFGNTPPPLLYWDGFWKSLWGAWQVIGNASGFHIIATVENDTGLSVKNYFDGSLASTGSAASAANGARFGNVLGYGDPINPIIPGVGASYAGSLAELLVLPTALSDTDRQAVEAYLHNKWFVAPSTTNRRRRFMLQGR